ncbi:MAG: DUF5915 domain-containing protein [Candidatus Moduliflexus flocculans]|nr:DUF5915 domain-containing protein [Candidatus Moduliflexus flocculans]
MQNLRKEAGLEVTDRIRLTLHGSDTLRKAFSEFEDYRRSETLASETLWAEEPGMSEIDMEGDAWKAGVGNGERVSSRSDYGERGKHDRKPRGSKRSVPSTRHRHRSSSILSIVSFDG